jgi:hypothetical protein
MENLISQFGQKAEDFSKDEVEQIKEYIHSQVFGGENEEDKAPSQTQDEDMGDINRGSNQLGVPAEEKASK